MSSAGKDAHSGGSSRLMSIHSMLGSSSAATDHRRNEVQRPSSAQEHPLPTSQLSSGDPNFRASSQPPLPGGYESRFFNPVKHEPNYGSMHQPLFPAPHNSRFPHTSSSAHPLSSQFNVHSMSAGNNNQGPPYHQMSILDRDREREDDRRRERDMDRNDERRSAAMRADSVSRTHHNHSPMIANHHHHHHPHRPHTPFRKPRLTVRSHKVFEEANTYPATKLGHWTYNPTIRLPFRLRINAVFTVHIPRRFLDFTQNSSLQKRKLWGTEIYTDDSDIAAVVLHSTTERIPAGDLLVSIRVMPRLVQYKSSMNGDLRSRGWSSKHDGLSLFVETMGSVSWTQETKGRGFTKRALHERYYLEKQGLRIISDVSWPPQKYRKINKYEVVHGQQTGEVLPTQQDRGSNVIAYEESDVIVADGDDTIEVSMEGLDNDMPDSSFVTPPGHPLISNVPEILPTSLSQDLKIPDAPIEDTSHTRDAAPQDHESSDVVALAPSTKSPLLPPSNQNEVEEEPKSIGKALSSSTIAPEKMEREIDVNGPGHLDHKASPIPEVEAMSEPEAESDAVGDVQAPADRKVKTEAEEEEHQAGPPTDASQDALNKEPLDSTIKESLDASPPTLLHSAAPAVEAVEELRTADQQEEIKPKMESIDGLANEESHQQDNPDTLATA